MKTGWPLSNGGDGQGSKMKPAGASTHRAAVNLSRIQNASCTLNLLRPLGFLKALAAAQLQPLVLQTCGDSEEAPIRVLL